MSAKPTGIILNFKAWSINLKRIGMSNRHLQRYQKSRNEEQEKFGSHLKIPF